MISATGQKQTLSYPDLSFGSSSSRSLPKCLLHPPPAANRHAFDCLKESATSLQKTIIQFQGQILETAHQGFWASHSRDLQIRCLVKTSCRYLVWEGTEKASNLSPWSLPSSVNSESARALCGRSCKMLDEQILDDKSPSHMVYESRLSTYIYTTHFSIYTYNICIIYTYLILLFDLI